MNPAHQIRTLTVAEKLMAYSDEAVLRVFSEHLTLRTQAHRMDAERLEQFADETRRLAWSAERKAP